MRTVGNRQAPAITFSASAELLREGARFNEEMHRLPTGSQTHVRKGLYFFKTHAEANQHDLDQLAQRMAEIAMERA